MGNKSILIEPYLLKCCIFPTDMFSLILTGNMHSVAMVETTIYRRNGKEAW